MGLVAWRESVATMVRVTALKHWEITDGWMRWERKENLLIFIIRFSNIHHSESLCRVSYQCLCNTHQTADKVLKSFFCRKLRFFPCLFSTRHCFSCCYRHLKKKKRKKDGQISVHSHAYVKCFPPKFLAALGSNFSHFTGCCGNR